MLGLYSLGFLSGGLSLLAPCVLPLLPLIISSSLRTSKLGPVLNALGLTLSFTFVGILTTTFSSFFSVELIKNIGAVILILAGLIFLLPHLKNSNQFFTQRISNIGAKLQGKLTQNRASSEFLGGAILGLIWSPCTGPTLALAIGLASQSEQLLDAYLVFLFFGLGAGLGLVSLGHLLKKFTFLKTNLALMSKKINFLTGATSVAFGVSILTGLDLVLQDLILDLMPSWLIKLSSSL